MALETEPFDPAAFLDTPEAVATYLSDALETGDAAFIRDALGVVARAEGMSAVARAAGLSRESLYRSLGSDGNPAFTTVVRVLNALGLRLSARPVEPSSAPAECRLRRASRDVCVRLQVQNAPPAAFRMRRHPDVSGPPPA